jgi:hypothetical protein
MDTQPTDDRRERRAVPVGPEGKHPAQRRSAEPAVPPVQAGPVRKKALRKQRKLLGAARGSSPSLQRS